MSDKSEINRDFYNNAYRSRGAAIGLLHTLVSYDQQSKSKRNIEQVNTAVPALNSGWTGRILDYGFGHGSLLLKFPRQCQLFGCDLSDAAITKFRKVCQLLNRKVTVGQPEDFSKFSSIEKFDIILCSHVLEHVDNDEELLCCFARVLKTDGILLLNLPINEVWRDPNHVRDYTPDSATRLLERCGFNVELILPADRMTAFLLTHEQLKKKNIAQRLAFRTARLLLALLPLQVVNRLEELLSDEYKHQQLLLIAKLKSQP